MMIPKTCVFFLFPDLAVRVGLNPHPDQVMFFPELITTYASPIMQPFSDKEYHKVMRGLKAINGHPSVGNRVSRKILEGLSVIGRGLEVRESRIPNSGRGLYAMRDFPEGEIITLYFGHLFGESERKLLQESGRGSHAKPLQFKHMYLDGVKTTFAGMHAGQLVNQGDRASCNCEWKVLELYPSSGERVLAIKATRYVHAGEELYISYGKKFWDEQGEQPSDVPEVRLPKGNIQ
jgi:hypothetical protein